MATQMAMTVARAMFALAASQQNPMGGTSSMATATGIKTKTVAKVTKTQKDAALRFKQAQQAANLLKMVSDPTRLQVVMMLSDGEKHVGALCEVLGQSQPAVSHHLALLRHGSIIAPRRQGKNNFYGLTETGEKLASIVKTVIG
jgi:DNA-binding transcriptional ArsR family regulator